MADLRCGAKTRSGDPCRSKKMSNGRCRMHGGNSKGPPKGSANAHKHGIYGDLIREDDLPVVDSLKSRVGIVDDELLMARLQLRRALRAQAYADDLPDGLEIFETVERADGAENAQARSEVKRKLRDYPQMIDRLMGRIESLEKTRKELMGEGNVAASEIHIHRMRAVKDES